LGVRKIGVDCSPGITDADAPARTIHRGCARAAVSLRLGDAALSITPPPGSGRGGIRDGALGEVCETKVQEALAPPRVLTTHAFPLNFRIL